jgi:hypothetical protein
VTEDVFEKGGAAFAGSHSSSRLAGQTERKMEAMEDRLRRKDEVIAEIMADLVRTKKTLGRAEWAVGSPRLARHGGRLPAPSRGDHRPARRALAALAGALSAQVPPLAGPLWQAQRTQCHDPPRPLDRATRAGLRSRLPKLRTPPTTPPTLAPIVTTGTNLTLPLNSNLQFNHSTCP